MLGTLGTGSKDSIGSILTGRNPFNEWVTAWLATPGEEQLKTRGGYESIGRFGFQRGVRLLRRFQLGLPA